MKNLNLLELLNNVKVLSALNCVSIKNLSLNVLDLLSDEEQFVQKIDLGVIFVKFTTLQNLIVVDGLQRILSVSLLLHAICECYKKTSAQNDKAIDFIRKNYLLSDNKIKLRLPSCEQKIYEKIINGERLSGREKKSPIFCMLHSMWTKIKQDGLQASDILKKLSKISIIIVETENVLLRDLYIALNKESRELNQYLLISEYLESLNIVKDWKTLNSIFENNEYDISLFFKDFFTTKFNFKIFEEKNMYNYFVNYFETMLQYMNKENIIENIIKNAKLYKDIVNVNFEDFEIKKAFIQIKLHKGEDTYAYLLNVYNDFIEKNITKATFLEILATINEYLLNRIKTPNNVSFNELVNYLNAFIACK